MANLPQALRPAKGWAIVIPSGAIVAVATVKHHLSGLRARGDRIVRVQIMPEVKP